MKLRNPVGREVGSGLEAFIDIMPFACKCSVEKNNYSAGQSTNDTCARCGCRCNGTSENDAANDYDADSTNRTS